MVTIGGTEFTQENTCTYVVNSKADGVQANYTENCTVIQYFFFMRR